MHIILYTTVLYCSLQCVQWHDCRTQAFPNQLQMRWSVVLILGICDLALEELLHECEGEIRQPRQNTGSFLPVQTVSGLSASE